MRPLDPRVVLLGAAALWAVAVCACGEARESSSGQELLAALGTAQALAHEADEYEARGDRERALERARAILEVPFPTQVAEREDVRLDAWGRVAELELALHREQAARTAIDSGLREVTRRSYFEARLYVVSGRVHRARAAALREAGDEEGAARASDAALEALEQSIEINAAVMGLDRPE